MNFRLRMSLREHMGRPARSDPNPVRRPALWANEVVSARNGSLTVLWKISVGQQGCPQPKQAGWNRVIYVPCITESSVWDFFYAQACIRKYLG